MNPIAWQLGHMLSAHRNWIELVSPGSCPPLPEGFAAAHSKEAAAPNPFQPVATRADYLDAWGRQRTTLLAVLDALPESELDGETGIPFAPTVAALLNLIGIHGLEHAGWFVAVRRKLGKPVVI